MNLLFRALNSRRKTSSQCIPVLPMSLEEIEGLWPPTGRWLCVCRRAQKRVFNFTMLEAKRSGKGLYKIRFATWLHKNDRDTGFSNHYDLFCVQLILMWCEIGDIVIK